MGGALRMRNLFKLIPCFVILLLAGCTTVHRHDYAPPFHINISKIPNAVPRPLPLSRYGNSTYTVDGKTYHVLKSAKGYDQVGMASWYGMMFYRHRTSDGDYYNVAGMTAASKSLPLPTFVRVTNLENGRQVIVKVNDRGPFHYHRIIDLSYVAAAKLGMLPTGTARVRVQAIDPWDYKHQRYEPSHYAAHTETRHETYHRETYHHAAATAGVEPFYLQIGAFSIRHSAELACDRAKIITHMYVRIEPLDDGGRTLYRVQVGPFRSYAAADEMTSRLKRAGFLHPMAAPE